MRYSAKVFQCFLKAKNVNIARIVVLVSPCLCSFNLYNFVRKVEFFSIFGELPSNYVSALFSIVQSFEGLDNLILIILH